MRVRKVKEKIEMGMERGEMKNGKRGDIDKKRKKERKK
jgi:hypothetical protein